MKSDIARQPLVPAFLTLLALTIVAVSCLNDGSGAGLRPAPPSAAGEYLTLLQHRLPVVARLLAGIMLLMTGFITGRLSVRYNLYSNNSCIAIPLCGITAAGLMTGGEYLIGFTVTLLLALSTQHFARSYINGYGFSALFRASLYLGLIPLILAPALPLLLLVPVTLLLFRRTLREVVVAFAGAALPLLAASYIYWGCGNSLFEPLLQFADCYRPDGWLTLWTTLPAMQLALLATIGGLDLAAIAFFHSDLYAAPHKSKAILLLNIGTLVILAGILCTPCAVPALLPALAIPTALLLPVLLVRIHRFFALLLYLGLLAFALCEILLR